MHATLVVTGLLVTFAASPSGQTAPVPAAAIGEPSGFLSRSAFFVAVAPIQANDPRASLVQRSRADIDVVSYPHGRVNFLIDTELVLGRERRAFDLNQVNVIFETSASYGVGPIELAAVVHHDSRHVVDREFDRVHAWHSIGVRGGHVFVTRQPTIDVRVEYGRIVQHTFVDYMWTSQLTLRLEQKLGRAAQLFAGGSGGVIGVDRAVVNRGPQTGARAEGGVRLAAERAALDLFAAYERRIDGYTTTRQRSSWFEVGFRLAGR